MGKMVGLPTKQRAQPLINNHQIQRGFFNLRPKKIHHDPLVKFVVDRGTRAAISCYHRMDRSRAGCVPTKKLAAMVASTKAPSSDQT